MMAVLDPMPCRSILYSNLNCLDFQLHPDSGHKLAEAAICIERRRASGMMPIVPERKRLFEKAAEGSSGSSSSLSGECKTGNAVGNRLTEQDEVYWTARISQLVQCGQNKQALKIYKEMRESGVKSSSYTYVAALKACGRLQDLEAAQKIHVEVVESGLHSDLVVGNVMVDVYARCGSLVDARHVFENMPLHDVVSWNAMILRYAQMEKGAESLKLYTRMQQEGVLPNDRTFVGALKACGSLAALDKKSEGDGKHDNGWCLEQVRAIHSHILKRGSESAVFVGTMLVDVYAKCGSLLEARCVFEKIAHRNVVSWTAMILGYAQMDKGDEALHLYTQMQLEGIVPNDRTYVGALKACSSLAAAEKMMEANGLLVKKRSLEQVRAIHSDVLSRGSELAVYVGTTLVDAYAKCGSLGDARLVFQKMPKRDVASWNAMILGYAQMEETEEALHLYTQMQQAGVVPSDRTFVGVLKACSTLAGSEVGNNSDRKSVKNICLEKVREIHSDVVHFGSESSGFVGNMFVDVYAKCGSLVEARQVFEKMSHRNVVSWNAMIFGYAQVEKGEESLQLYWRMKQEGVVPDDRTFVGALKACSSLGKSEDGSMGDLKHAQIRCLDQVKAIHSDVMDMEVASDVFVGTTLLDAYANCGSMVDARSVFENMPHRNVVSWNAMILKYAQIGEGEEALQLYARMLQEGVDPDDRTFVGALKACSSLAPSEEGGVGKQQCLRQVRAIHSDLVKREFEADVFVGTMLVDVYAKCGSLVDARRVFESMPHRNVVSWNAMILGYAQLLDGGAEALQLYTRMQQEDIVPNDRTFVAALKACCTLASLEGSATDERHMKKACLEHARAIHSDVEKTAIGLVTFVGNMLVDVYTKCGSLVDARGVFEQMPYRDVVSWNSMISCYAQMKEGEKALQLYALMQQESVLPDERTFVGVLKACSILAAPAEGNRGDGRAQCLEQVRAVHSDVVKRGFYTDVFVGTMLVDVYAKCGSLVDARYVFERMPHRNVVAWNAMILGYTQMEDGHEALQLYARMQQEGVVPDGRTFVGALKACGLVAGLEKGKEIHAQIQENGYEGSGLFLLTTLIDMYSKCGSMDNAQEVFDALRIRDVVTWSALISGYAHKGESELVFDLLQRMRQEGFQPDSITFLNVLTACSHLGLVDKGQEYFQVMTRDGITPTIDHYTCIVDLLSRAGQLEKAMALVKTMPFRPDAVVWQTVLGACRKWTNVDVGRQAFEMAVRLDKTDAASYALMSNIYAAANMWEEVNEMQLMKVETGAWKQPGQSWTDISGTVHTFLVGDQEHPECQSIYAKVQAIFIKLREEGCASLPLLDSLLQDRSDNERDDTFCGHSIKLAFACDLLYRQYSKSSAARIFTAEVM